MTVAKKAHLTLGTPSYTGVAITQCRSSPQPVIRFGICSSEEPEKCNTHTIQKIIVEAIHPNMHRLNHLGYIIKHDVGNLLKIWLQHAHLDALSHI